MKSLATPSAEFTDVHGDNLAVLSNDHDSFLVRINPGPDAQPDLSGVILKTADAPAVALAILTAAGLIKPAGVVAEDTTPGCRRQTIDGEYFSSNSDPEFWVDSTAEELDDLIRKAQRLVNHIAVRDYFADEPARAAEAAAKVLNRRRDELANEHAPRLDAAVGSNWYENVSPGLRSAIDMIIQLQDEATK